MTTTDREELVSELVLTHYEDMYRLAYTYVHNEDDAMDIVQESVYKAIRNADKIREHEYMKSWLFKIVIRTALDLLRARKREVVQDTFKNELTHSDRYQDFDTLQALEILESKEKTIIILRYFEDQKISDIADIFRRKCKYGKIYSVPQS